VSDFPVLYFFLRIPVTLLLVQIAWIWPDSSRWVNDVWDTLCRGYFGTGGRTRRHWTQGYTCSSGRDRKGRMCWPEASNSSATYDGSRKWGCRPMLYGWTDTQDVRNLAYLLTIFFFSFWYRIQFLRDVQTFFGTSFKIVTADPLNPDCSQLLYSCYGTGYVNANRTLAWCWYDRWDTWVNPIICIHEQPENISSVHPVRAGHRRIDPLSWYRWSFCIQLIWQCVKECIRYSGQ
jgi:hypothetical protein